MIGQQSVITSAESVIIGTVSGKGLGRPQKVINDWKFVAAEVITVKGCQMHTGCSRQDSRMTRDGVKICGLCWATNFDSARVILCPDD